MIGQTINNEASLTALNVSRFIPLMRQSQHLSPGVHLPNSSKVSIDPIAKIVIWNSACFG